MIQQYTFPIDIDHFAPIIDFYRIFFKYIIRHAVYHFRSLRLNNQKIITNAVTKIMLIDC